MPEKFYNALKSDFIAQFSFVEIEEHFKPESYGPRVG